MSNLNQMLAGLFLYLSVITPFALYNKYSELMLTLKFFFFFIFFIISRKKLLLKYFIIGLFIMILGSIATLISEYEISITRFILYLTIIFFLSFRLEYFKLFFFKRLYIMSVFILSVVSILNPDITNFFYGWNDYKQQVQFLEQNKYTSIFGLPATASLCYGLIIFSLLSSQSLFNKKILFILVPFFLFLLISLKSTSSLITIIFLLLYCFFSYYKRANLLSFIYLIILSIFFYILIIILSDLENFYKNIVVLSFVNRFTQDYFLHGFSFVGTFFGFGFISSSITFGDVGYFDHFIRLGFFGTIFFYFLYYNFLKRLLFNQNYFILILYIFILELGHNYSKSVVFLPIILIILFNPTNKHLVK